MVLPLQLLDLLADRARFLFAVPDTRHAGFFAGLVFREQGLAEPVLVMRDQPRGGTQDVPGRAVIVLEPHHRRPRKVMLEAQDVVDLGATPAIDRLIVVTDAAEVVPALRQKSQPEILDHVGILILVHQHVFESALVLLQDVGILAEKPQTFEQQVAEVGGVEGLQPRLIGGIEDLPFAIGEGSGLAGRNAGGFEPAVLPAVDEMAQAACRPALVVDVCGLEDLLQQADLIVGIQDRESGLQPHEFGMSAQDLGRDGVECPEPGHTLARRPDERSDALLHLPRRLVGERDRKDLVRPCPTCRHHVGDAGRQHAGLAGAGTSENQDGAVDGFDGASLFRVQSDEIRGRQRRTGAISDAARARRGRRERGGFGQSHAPEIRRGCRFVSDQSGTEAECLGPFRAKQKGADRRRSTSCAIERSIRVRL